MVQAVLLTPWNKVFLEKFLVTQLVKKFSEMAVFWVVAPCSLVEVYRRFNGDRPDDGGSKEL
jgi:hypothetical protein